MTAIGKSHDIKEAGTRWARLIQERAGGDVPHYYDGVVLIADGQCPFSVQGEGSALYPVGVPL